MAVKLTHVCELSQLFWVELSLQLHCCQLFDEPATRTYTQIYTETRIYPNVCTST